SVPVWDWHVSVIVVVVTHCLSWLTYRHIENPLRARVFLLTDCLDYFRLRNSSVSRTSSTSGLGDESASPGMKKSPPPTEEPTVT
ncbi:unnamed protein product, partial [Amoebophrya sp. A25]